MTEANRDYLMRKFKRTVAVIIDEHSMVSLKTLGEAIDNMSETAHNGTHRAESGGGIPVVILLGDDCQMPPPMSKGAFDVFTNRVNFTPTEVTGVEMFLQCAKNVMTLQKKKRTMTDQIECAESLDKARTSNLQQETADEIVSQLSLHDCHWEDRKKLASGNGVLFVSADKAPVAEHNMR